MGFHLRELAKRFATHIVYTRAHIHKLITHRIFMFFLVFFVWNVFTHGWIKEIFKLSSLMPIEFEWSIDKWETIEWRVHFFSLTLSWKIIHTNTHMHVYITNFIEEQKYTHTNTMHAKWNCGNFISMYKQFKIEEENPFWFVSKY